MKQAAALSPNKFVEHLHPVLGIASRRLGIRTAEIRKPIRVSVLRAQQANRVIVPPAAISDWTNKRPS
jgi:hypothetical protein